jgi:hypothetical protein
VVPDAPAAAATVMALSNFASARWNVCSRLSGCPKTNLLLASSSENGTPGQNVSPSSSVVYPGQAEHLGVPGRRRRQRPVARRGELRERRRARCVLRNRSRRRAVVGARRAEVDVAALLEGVAVDELVGAQPADEDHPSSPAASLPAKASAKSPMAAGAQRRQRGLVAQVVGVDDAGVSPRRARTRRAGPRPATRQRPAAGSGRSCRSRAQKLTLTRAEKRRTGAWLRKSLWTKFACALAFTSGSTPV